jgi:hypothetical protein
MAVRRGHSTPEAPHTPAAGHRGPWRDFHGNKTDGAVQNPPMAAELMPPMRWVWVCTGGGTTPASTGGAGAGGYRSG